MSTNRLHMAKVHAFRPLPPTRDALIRQHLYVVDQVVNYVAARLPPYARTTRDELRSAGYVGLIQAAEAFDHTRGCLFVAFCWKRISGAMVDQLRADDPIGRRTRILNKAGRALAAQLRQELGREPTRQEIAAGLDIPTERFECIAVLHTELDDPTPMLEQAPAPVDTEADLMRKEQLEHVWAAILSLPRRLQRIIVLYYFDDKSMGEVGRELGVNESRISQLHARAIRQLRLALIQHGTLPTRARARTQRVCDCAKCQRARSRGTL